MWTLSILSPREEFRELSLKPGTTSLGRSMESDIQILDESASRNHAEIQYTEENNGLVIRDLDSFNGVYLNGKRIKQQHSLAHKDKIRIGLHIFTVFSEQELLDHRDISSRSSTLVVSRDLLIESIDQYAAFLHDISHQLNTSPDLNTAMAEVSTLVKRIMGADRCKVVITEDFEELKGIGIPISVVRGIIEQQSATIIENVQADPIMRRSLTLQGVDSILCVPVIVDEKVVALIYAEKSVGGSRTFQNHDLRLAVAIGHQVALTVQRKKTEAELIRTARHDALTNLPNRTFFLEQLRQAIENSRGSADSLFAVLFLDLDQFKMVNDGLGHSVGDKILFDVAQRLLGATRVGDNRVSSDMVARFGGDEFAILLENIKEEGEALTVAKRVQQVMEQPFEIDGREVIISASIGITMSHMGYKKAEDMLRDADIAMYQVKENGKAGYEVYDQPMHASLMEKLDMQIGLRRAINNDELLLHYQPILSLKKGSIVGFEALLRWDSPDKGLVYPDKFLSITDTTGLLTSIDHWVLDTACQQMNQWHKENHSDPPLYISVNLSGKQIKHPLLVEQVDQVLKETGLEAKNLWLEITESTSIKNSEPTLGMLEELRMMGVFISLDDFGTGFSSLSYLHRFPVSALKIDRSFVSQIGGEGEGKNIIETIVSLGHQLGLDVIMEGVETAEQMEFVRSLGCDYAQGYYFSKPLPASEVQAFMAKAPTWSHSS
jgi:diguanylate cyclase (GGDEF)-like protein